jgi:hypothetical protein
MWHVSETAQHLLKQQSSKRCVCVPVSLLNVEQTTNKDVIWKPIHHLNRAMFHCSVVLVCEW